MKYFSGEL